MFIIGASEAPRGCCHHLSYLRTRSTIMIDTAVALLHSITDPLRPRPARHPAAGCAPRHCPHTSPQAAHRQFHLHQRRHHNFGHGRLLRWRADAAAAAERRRAHALRCTVVPPGAPLGVPPGVNPRRQSPRASLTMRPKWHCDRLSVYVRLECSSSPHIRRIVTPA